MGNEQSILGKKGYKIEEYREKSVVATKGDDKFLIKKVDLHETDLISEIETLNKTNHPHIVSSKNSFEDEKTYYVVMDYCQGGSLVEKIREKSRKEEFEVLNWIVEICVALRTIHEKGISHKNLMPENIFLTEFGIVCLGGFGKVREEYLAPEVLTEGTYDAKSDIWSVGCILYELCTSKLAFSAETTIKLIPKIIKGPYPSLPEDFSPELRELLNDIFNKDPQSRPTATEILQHPIMINCLTEKSKTMVKELQIKLDKLRDVADSLERVHQGTTIGSLAGGVIGAVGGITSIVGLILAPFTLGASLIVTGVGIGVGTLGGVTAGASNVTNMVNQSSDRKAIRSIIKEFDQKMNAVVIWLEEINNSLQKIRSRSESVDTEAGNLQQENLFRAGVRAGRGLGGIAELLRLVQVMNIGKIAAQVSRAVRVAEVATGALSGLFVAADIFFIAMDAREIHHIRQARASMETNVPVSETDASDLMATSDQHTLLPSPFMQEVTSDTSGTQDQSSSNTTQIRSEIMKFVISIRETADKLQKVLDELKSIILFIHPPQDERALEQQDMELM
ncbi:serine/threonine-protein kinase kin-29-like [Thunnus albacares]|uniref:serine/threonine-protein kinase kin-29-like n=1 Tax=Thunnus albacares TaxID=8236 RepID=UPI001CF6ACF5|nr:serine/threonine-protein kinase kin-29-like [Thunnus albacares]